MKQSNIIAIDLGANSGRAIVGRFGKGQLEVDELHRFSNGPVSVHGRLYWDVLKMFTEVKESLCKYASKYDEEPLSIGIDSWGVDYSLFDSRGRLIHNPVHYRDVRTQGKMKEAFEVVPREEIFRETGIQFMELNTLYQLFAQQHEDPESLDYAQDFLMMADVFHYFLTGQMTSEFTLTTTSQLYDPVKKRWASGLFEKFNFPMEIMPKVIAPGTQVGNLTADIAEDVGLGQIPVIAPASHDTASAVAAIPASGRSWGFISSGTWSLLGKEITDPLINQDVLDANFTNEGGVAGTYRFLRNLTGLWLVQECKREWARNGENYSYEELTNMASHADGFSSFVDPDHQIFQPPRDMPGRICQFCSQTGQEIPAGKAELIRLILDSLALNYRYVMDKLESLLKEKIEIVHIVGGGVRNQLLSQFSANALNRTVITGPAESTAIGNVLVQGIELGEISSLSEGRKIVGNSVNLETYKPENINVWNDAYKRFCQLKAQSTS